MIFLSSPYSHPSSRERRKRWEQACHADATLRRQGLNVISPIAYSHIIAAREHIDPHAAHWYEWSLDLARLCDECIVLCVGGWRESKGVQAEINDFRARGRRVRYLVNGRIQYTEPEGEE